MIRAPVLLISLALVQPASGQEMRPTGPWKADRFSRGDTLVVRTVSGSVWGDKVGLAEELRIGTKDGEGPDAFGEIRAFALFPDGVMTVFDKSVPALRLFDPAGKYLRTLGRNGAGPGEYRNDALGLAVDRDGVLIMYDLRNARLNRWKETGTVLPAWSWISRSVLYSFWNALHVDTTGSTYLLVASQSREPGKDVKRGYARFDRSGKLVDTLRQPAIEGPDELPGPFGPYKHWVLTRTGGAITGHSAVYSLTVAEPGLAAVRIERGAPRIALQPDERKSWEDFFGARSRVPGAGAGAAPSGVPSSKPFYSQLHSDLDGRIWVQLYAKGEPFDPPTPSQRPGEPPRPPLPPWRERGVWDVFRRDGSYLGQLELPWRTTFAEAKGDRVWTIQQGEDDEQYIVRYRISPVR